MGHGHASLQRIDVLGAILCAAATICLILGLTWGGQQRAAWTSPPVLGMLAAGIVLLILFLFVERLAREPILPLDLFRNPVFRVGASLSLLQSMVLLGLALYLPLFFQGVLHVSPTRTGLVMTPFSISMVAGAVLSGLAINRLKRYRMIAIGAALLMSVGSFLTHTPGSGFEHSSGDRVHGADGCGHWCRSSRYRWSQSRMRCQSTSLAVGTAALRYLGQVGATLGIAIVGTVVTSGVSGDLMSQLPTNRH